nr:GNAT family N-acetyltransferase [Pseudomarimonas arenosa]
MSQRPAWVDRLADWHYAEWGALYGPDWSRQAAHDELVEHAQRQHWPNTLIADQAGDLLGSVSLVEKDAPSLDHFGSSWLASLYVRPSARGRGVAKQLVQSLCRFAADEGLSRLWLFTPFHRDYYQRLGWNSVTQAEVYGQTVDVMSLQLGPETPR